MRSVLVQPHMTAAHSQIAAGGCQSVIVYLSLPALALRLISWLSWYTAMAYSGLVL